MTTRWFSLKRRLLLLMLGGVATAWLVMVGVSYVDAHHEVDELFDAQLAQVGQTLLALATQEAGHPISNLAEAAHKYQRRLRFQVWNADGQLLMRSQNAPETALTGAEGFTETHDLAAGHWRHFSQWNAARTLQIQVSEDHQVRDEIIGHIASRLLLPALLGLPVIGLWVWLATRRGLSSLDSLARDITRRRPAQLQALTPATAPVEVRPLVDSLNGLFQRVERALDNERHFTADAAHELRTPLAALQAQLHVARHALNDTERARSLAQLQHGLDRTAHLVDQMLQLARLDPDSLPPVTERVSLTRAAQEVCAELGAEILARGVDFDLEAPAECRIACKAEWLHVLIRNLVDNALRYTPAGGRIRVIVRGDAAGAVLEVHDDGPGIPVEAREQVLRRFHRLDSSRASGSGLGLAIVARIVEHCGATLTLDDSLFDHGLRVSVRFKPLDAVVPAL